MVSKELYVFHIRFDDPDYCNGNDHGSIPCRESLDQDFDLPVCLCDPRILACSECIPKRRYLSELFRRYLSVADSGC